jgi:hypothetical protein
MEQGIRELEAAAGVLLVNYFKYKFFYFSVLILIIFFHVGTTKLCDE